MGSTTPSQRLVKSTIGNHVVGGILIDNGSSLDILYRHTFGKIDSLEPSYTQLYGFIWDSIMPSGMISMLLTIGQHPRMKTVNPK